MCVKSAFRELGTYYLNINAPPLHTSLINTAGEEEAPALPGHAAIVYKFSFFFYFFLFCPPLLLLKEGLYTDFHLTV